MNMNYIIFDKVTKSFGYEKIFDDLSFKVFKGEHIGLIGNNGSGKTTIFRMITGCETIDSGRISVRSDIRIGYLEQETSGYDGMKIIEVLRLPFKEVLDAVSKLGEHEEKMSKLSGRDLEYLLDDYGKQLAFVEFNDGYGIDTRILSVATGLGIDTGRFDDILDNLSGGERTRIFLCKLLLEEPDLLLLDEPTNHLDIIAVGWLEKFLSAYDGTVLTVSHDRTFLDNSVSKVIEIENKKAVEYPGNFSWYKEEKARRQEIQEKQFNNQQKEIKRLEKAARQMREWARQADNKQMYKRAVNVERRLEHMDKVDGPVTDTAAMKMQLRNTNKSGKEVIKLDEVRKSFDGKIVLDGINLLLRKGEKAVISGQNGSGKSTLANIINNVLFADSGTVKVGEGIKTGYLPQEIYFEDEKRTLLEEVQRSLGPDAGKAQKVLATYGFKGEHVMKRISALSGGERKRLRFGTMMQHEYNLLVMDEPTNHMDIGSREILEEALMDYSGTCLFISHDRFFINKVCSVKYLLHQGHLNGYIGDYTKLLTEEKTPVNPEPSGQPVSSDKNISKNKVAEVERLEKDISLTETSIGELDERMMEKMPLNELELILQERQSLKESLELLYEKWASIMQ
jgi:ATPase subunit of ABC transporter with duplicated ATPase domains